MRIGQERTKRVSVGTESFSILRKPSFLCMYHIISLGASRYVLPVRMKRIALPDGLVIASDQFVTTMLVDDRHIYTRRSPHPEDRLPVVGRRNINVDIWCVHSSVSEGMASRSRRKDLLSIML